MSQFNNNDYVLRHTLAVRLFHWSLVLGFLPAGFTGALLFLRPFLAPYLPGIFTNAAIMHLMMQIHIIGAWILTLGCVLFFIFQYKKVGAFLHEIFDWTKRGIDWMKVSGGYPQKILFNKEVPVPPMGKINSGQKMMGVMVFFGGIIIILTGWVLYLALPLVPKEIAWYADKIHLIVGLGLLACVCGGHIPLGMYNWKEFICMFTNGRIRVNDSTHHHPLWVEHDLEKVKD